MGWAELRGGEEEIAQPDPRSKGGYVQIEPEGGQVDSDSEEGGTESGPNERLVRYLLDHGASPLRTDGPSPSFPGPGLLPNLKLSLATYPSHSR